jgi:hypothetical protein
MWLENGDEVLFLAAGRGFPHDELERTYEKEKGKYSFQNRVAGVRLIGEAS